MNIQSVEWKTSPPVRVGSRIAFVAQFLGRRLAYTYEVVELVPGERLVQRTAGGRFPMKTTNTWETRSMRPRLTGRHLPLHGKRICSDATRPVSRTSVTCLGRVLEDRASKSKPPY